MNRLELAIRTFFWTILNKRFAGKVEPFFVEKRSEELESIAIKNQPQPVESKPQPVRSDAIQIVAMLQREGRLVDFLKEPIDSYNDAQIGAAVRDIHRDCGGVLERVFGLIPTVDKSEGETVQVLPGFDPERYRLSGNVTGNPLYSGVVRHHGWKATRCDLPVWRGSDDSRMNVAPAEVEI